MTTYLKYSVNLTDGQKQKFAQAFKKKCPLTVRLSNSQLSGPDELILTKIQVAKIEKSKKNGTAADISISVSQLRNQEGGNLFSTLMNVGRIAAPYLSTVVKPIGLSGLSSLVSGGVENFSRVKINLEELFSQFRRIKLIN